MAALLAVGLTVCTACASRGAVAADTPNGSLNLSGQGLALDGYDPVSYFSEGTHGPARGRRDLSVNLRGVVYRFGNEGNRDRFLADPEAFEPAYGGWCAWGMAKNKKINIDPESFLIEEGRLLLFYDGFFNDTRKAWLKHGGADLLLVADQHWGRFVAAGHASGPAHKEQAGGGPSLGLAGNDPVSSFRGEGTRPGLKTIYTRLGGIEYRFLNERNRTAFLRDPESFLGLPER